MTQYGQWYGPHQHPGGWQGHPVPPNTWEREEWEPGGNATDGMNFFRDEREYDHYKGSIVTPGKALRKLYKASGLSSPESRSHAKRWLKDKASKTKDAVGDLIYRIKNSGPHSQQFFIDDDYVITKGYSTIMNELNKAINAARFSMFQDRNFSALDGFDAAVRMFADAAQQKKKDEKKPSFWKKNKNKILTGAAALALVGGAAYGGYKWGQSDSAEAIKKLEEAIADLEKQKNAAFANGQKSEAARLGKEITSLKNQLNWAYKKAKEDPMWYQKRTQKNVMSQVDKKAQDTNPFKNDGWMNNTTGKGTLG